jgi:hypothetical protein
MVSPSGAFKHISTGRDFACGIKEAENTVACWGYGWVDGTAYSWPVPDGEFKSLSSGGYLTCGIKLDDTMECWGRETRTSILASGFTPAGTDVNVWPLDVNTGELGPVWMTFDEITSAGETTVEGNLLDPPDPPAHMLKLGVPPVYYEIITEATFTGNVEVCVDYSGEGHGNEEALELFHFEELPPEGGTWEVITTTRDTEADVICGRTSSFSVFQVMEADLAEITAITLPPDPGPVGTPTSVSATFTHATGTGLTAEVEWGDGNVTNGVLDALGGTITADHTYQTAGVYTVEVRILEGPVVVSRSSAEEATTSFLVAFDPSGGYVTGGGWINSPPGACLYAACTVETTGKATFGFVSRYENGANTPEGHTVFHFKAGDLRFHSSSYDWMVPAGSKAQFKGSGQINKDGDYGFMITAIDGDLKPHGGDDQFRIKIWDKGTDQVVYDNKLGEAENSDAATVLGGGSIVIHK